MPKLAPITICRQPILPQTAAFLLARHEFFAAQGVMEFNDFP
jgi:hypothetical protein